MHGELCQRVLSPSASLAMVWLLCHTDALGGPSACSSGPSVCLQTCHEGEDPGEIVIRLRKQDILKVHTSHMVLHISPEDCFSQALHDDHGHMICLLRVICCLLACRCPDWGRLLWTQEAQRQ